MHQTASFPPPFVPRTPNSCLPHKPPAPTRTFASPVHSAGAIFSGHLPPILPVERRNRSRATIVSLSSIKIRRRLGNSVSHPTPSFLLYFSPIRQSSPRFCFFFLLRDKRTTLLTRELFSHHTLRLPLSLYSAPFLPPPNPVVLLYYKCFALPPG